MAEDDGAMDRRWHTHSDVDTLYLSGLGKLSNERGKAVSLFYPATRRPASVDEQPARGRCDCPFELRHPVTYRNIRAVAGCIQRESQNEWRHAGNASANANRFICRGNTRRFCRAR